MNNDYMTHVRRRGDTMQPLTVQLYHLVGGVKTPLNLDDYEIDTFSMVVYTDETCLQEVMTRSMSAVNRLSGTVKYQFSVGDYPSLPGSQYFFLIRLSNLAGETIRVPPENPFVLRLS